MSKVSTRPQKSVTPVAAPKTLVANQAHQSPTSSQAQAPLSHVVSTVLAIIEQVKLDHERAQDSEGVSAHSMTLVEMAEKTLQQFLTAATANAGLESVMETLAWEAAALLAGALAWDVKRSPSCTSRHQLIDQAGQLMDAAAASFGLVSHPGVDLAIGIQAGAAVKGRKGYTVQHLLDALELIAGRTSTLEAMLMEIGDRCTGTVPAWELATAVNAATIVTNSIGFIADEVSGADVVGNWERWTFGRNFAESRKALQS